MTIEQTSSSEGGYDYIVVGSGAGGGPLAARLARAGYKVLVLEAGPDHTATADEAREVSLVPSLHGVSTEHPDLSWRFFVKHYDNPPTGEDPKNHPRSGDEQPPPHGIFYPRAAGLGGCTIHNAMITIVGPDSDWEDLADYVADDSWRAGPMRAYFQRLEHNDYMPRPTPSPISWWGRFYELLKWVFGFDTDHTSGRHGFDGWLHTSLTSLSLGFSDRKIVKIVIGALLQSICAGLDRVFAFVKGAIFGRFQEELDPNHARTLTESPEGLARVPLAVCGEGITIHQNSETPFVIRGRRSSPREFLLGVKHKCPDNLTIETDALVTNVIFEPRQQHPRAVGVRYLSGKRLYKAHQSPLDGPAVSKSAFVKPRGEVILCGGTFNTPQILMLSGLGNTEDLANAARDGGNFEACALQGRDGIPLRDENGYVLRIDLPGIGRNLQDRYEVSVVSELKSDFSLLDRATFALPGGRDPDPHLKEWRAEGTGLYTSNGAVLGIFKRSQPDLMQPDLFIFGVPLPFKGYDIGYSKVGHIHNQFTWVVLKAHTHNTDGTVKLKSTDPRDTPAINFHYFSEVTRNSFDKKEWKDEDEDLRALLDGVKFIRGISNHARWFTSLKEEYPNIGDNDEDLKNWIPRVAWGHHACGTCRMGRADDPGAVLDSRFKVRKVDGLRVVDASIFPRIPGYFIVTNIYMASEKAADVIIEDAKFGGQDSASYPQDLRALEAEAIRVRRKAAGAKAQDVSPELVNAQTWPSDVTGLALAGGGVRCATLCLGIIQAMARTKCLRRIDIMSTVSGGGYIGAFLGRWFDRFSSDSRTKIHAQPPEPATDRIEQELVDSASPALHWLRKNANYIGANGTADAFYNAAVFVRNILSVHFLVALLLFTVFGFANFLRYGLLDPATSLVDFILPSGYLPLGYVLQAVFGVLYSPWFYIFELIVLFVALPRIVGYWIASQDHHSRYDGPALAALLATSGFILFASVNGGFNVQLFILGIAPLTALFRVEFAWRRGRKRERALGRGGVETQRLRTRNYLTNDLASALGWAGAAFIFALSDTAGHALHQALMGNQIYIHTLVGLGAAWTALIPIGRSFVGTLSSGKPSSMVPSIVRVFRNQIGAGVLAAILFIGPLILMALVAHAAYQGGIALVPGLGASIAALILSAILAHPKNLTFVNRSSLSETYAAKLARTYLGATNPQRFRADGANVTEVVPGDDESSIRDYRPHAAGGPLHLINVTVNQTVDFTSQRGNRDRKGENLAVSSIGMSVGIRSHGAWAEPQEDCAPRRKVAALKPLGYLPGTDHPLVDEAGEPAKRAEDLSLRQWMAISGAAFGPASGQSTSLGTALLFGLTNFRTGYWWNSGIGEVARDGYPALTFLKRMGYFLTFLFQTQTLLLSEWLARFAGPWEQFWYLSDGGHFEVSGAYELIRRRVPRIILCDGSADPEYRMGTIADLMRKARIDFSARIEPFGEEDYAKLPDAVRKWVGPLEDLKPRTSGNGDDIKPSKKHASLFWIRYDNAPNQTSVMLYIKATVTGDENTDVLNYQQLNPDFPHESTLDQFFDEAQWESYRRLGEHIMRPLCGGDFWFWNIDLRKE